MAAITNPSQPAMRALLRAILLGSFPFGILMFSLPIVTRTFGGSAIDIGGIVSIFALTITVMRPLVGWGLDRFGRKTFLVAALLFYAAAMVVFAFSESVTMLYIARMVQGIGSSLLWIPAYTIATELAADKNRGRAIGLVDETSSQGALYGSLFGFAAFTALSSETTWRPLFLGYAAATIIGAFLAWRGVPETRKVSIEPEANTPKNVIDRTGLYKLMAIVILTSMTSAMISPLLMIFLQDRFTTDMRLLATAFIPAVLVYSFLPSRMGNLSDRFGRAPLMAVGLIGAGIVSMFMPSLTSLWVLTALWALEALGFVMAGPAEGALVADLTGENVRGTGYGLYTFAQGVGLTVGPLLGGWLYDAAGHAVPFYLNGAVLIAGAGLVLVLLRRKSERGVAN